MSRRDPGTARPPAGRRACRGAARRDQGGFALIAGLMIVIALCTVTLIALMELTVSGSKISVTQATQARQARAADSALDTAITRMRMDASGRSGLPSDTSGGCIDPPGGATGMNYSAVDGTQVLVTATCDQGSGRLAAPESGQSSVPPLDVVGGGYTSPAGVPDTVGFRTDCPTGSTGGATCYPWRAAIGGANFADRAAQIAAASPSVVHTTQTGVDDGGATLGFSGDLNVAGSALPMVNGPKRTGVAGLSVAGAFRQGSNGLFSDVTGGGCGILSGGFPWGVPGSRVVDTDDSAGQPTCGTAVTTANEGLAAPASWARISPLATTPACPAGSGSVATFSPGAYTAAETRKLNDLMGGTCAGRVLWFQPGEYWFDVDDTSNPPVTRNALVIDDPTIRVVMGKPTGGTNAAAAAAAGFPGACDTAAAGVSITVSPRTSIRHLRGQVAVCDRSAATPGNTTPPAIWQTPDADGGWVGTPDPARSSVTLTRDTTWIAWGSASVTDQANAWSVDGRSAVASSSCTILLAGGCGVDVNVAASRIGATTPAPSAAVGASRVNSLDLIVNAVARNTQGFTISLVGGGQSSTRITFTKAGATSPTCAVGFPSIPDPRSATVQNTIAYDLFSPQAEAIPGLPRCIDVRDGAGLTRNDLRGSAIDLRYRAYSFLTLFGSYTTTVSIDGLELRAGWDLTPSAATGGTGWNNATNLLAPDGQHGGYTLTCSGSCPTATRNVTATGFDNPTSPWVPTDGSLLEAGVMVTGETTKQNFFTNGSYFDVEGAPDVADNSTLRVTVNMADGTSCTVQWPRIPFWGQSLYLDLLDSPGTCRSRLTSAAQLIGASATLDVFVQRNAGSTTTTYGTRIDHLKISTVSSGRYTGPTSPFLVTQSSPSSGTPSTFNVYGGLSAPVATMNFTWAGPSPVRNLSPVPVLGGRSVLGAIGSTVLNGGQAGVVCCAGTRPSERIVNLRAVAVLADGTRPLIGTASVRISDRGGNGSSVRVVNWSTG
ncbi:MAG: hypothetical protein ACOYOP_08335 [Microthrixaceae bacterium]